MKFSTCRRKIVSPFQMGGIKDLNFVLCSRKGRLNIKDTWCSVTELLYQFS